MIHASIRGPSPRGFALVAVLWVMASVAVLGVSLTQSGSEAATSAQNRVDLVRAEWRAEGCAESARSMIDEALATKALGTDEALARVSFDPTLPRSGLVEGCNLALRATGTTVDINAADSARIRAVLLAIGQPIDRADSLVDALLDWRNADDVPRPRGAEKSWYVNAHRIEPRNGPIASLDELRLVRGFDQIDGLDTLFGVDAERVDLERAPVAVLASLPGLDMEALSLIIERRRHGEHLRDLGDIVASLSPVSRERLLANYSDLVRRTTTTPDAWLLVSRVSAGRQPIVATVELRLVNAGKRAAVVRRRSWP